MTFSPQAPFGTGGDVTATVDNTVANFGATNFPHSPNFSAGESSTETYETTALNVSNLNTTVPSNAGTT